MVLIHHMFVLNGGNLSPQALTYPIFFTKFRSAAEDTSEVNNVTNLKKMATMSEL